MHAQFATDISVHEQFFSSVNNRRYLFSHCSKILAKRLLSRKFTSHLYMHFCQCIKIGGGAVSGLETKFISRLTKIYIGPGNVVQFATKLQLIRNTKIRRSLYKITLLCRCFRPLISRPKLILGRQFL
jgi:hypothetical protein